VTSQGSELVAARATDAGVTDYLIKTVGGEQATQFVTKIERAVAHHRLQRAIEESEQRYRTVTEQSRDGVTIVQYGQLRFCNERLTELTGRERERLEGGDVVAEAVHPDDRDQVRTVVDSWFEGEEQSRLHEARIVWPEGTVRHCEYTGGRIDYRVETAVLLSVQDVTERNRRERELQWERELNRPIHEALAESRTRQSLEDRTTDQLRRHGYALAWIGEQVGNEVVPRSVSGDRQYVETIDRSLDTDDPDGEPAVLATRTGEAQFYGNLADLSSTAWTARAAQHDYRSCAAVSLVHNDISYGVLAVYHDQPDRFDETEQRLLTELADTVAFAVHSRETSDALAADQPLEVTVELSDGHYLLDLARQGAFGDCETVDVVGTVPVDDETALQYVDVFGGSVATVREAVDESPAVRETAVVTDDDPVRLQVTVIEPVPEARLAARGIVVGSTTVGAETVIRSVVSHFRDSPERPANYRDTVTTDRMTLSFELETRADLRPTVDSLTEAFGRFRSARSRQGHPSRKPAATAPRRLPTSPRNNGGHSRLRTTRAASSNRGRVLPPKSPRLSASPTRRFSTTSGRHSANSSACSSSADPPSDPADASTGENQNDQVPASQESGDGDVGGPATLLGLVAIVAVVLGSLSWRRHTG
jgi:PAS domain S-box-containing protein